MPQRLNITLLGHKDHGKSTLIGRLLFDTGSVMEDRVQEVREISRTLGKPFEYAFLLDSFEEERKDGMTIDVIHAQIKGSQYLYDCIDVPGHRELIQNMLTGASNADAGILIVSAKEGIEEQTLQHLGLAQWLGMEQIIIAINKMDQVGYDQKVFEAMKDSISTLVGIGLSREVSYVPVSAYEGDNLVVPSATMAWYNGPTLYELMENLSVPQDLSKMPLLLPVQDIYTGANGERIAVGKIESGSVHVGQRVFFAPSGGTATVEAILTQQKNTTVALSGENVGIVLNHNTSRLKRGDVCCSAEAVMEAREEATARVVFLEPALRQATVECGTAQTDCEIETIIPAEVGEVAEVTLRFKERLVVGRSKTTLGRMALKRQGKIVGVAVAM